MESYGLFEDPYPLILESYKLSYGICTNISLQHLLQLAPFDARDITINFEGFHIPQEDPTSFPHGIERWTICNTKFSISGPTTDDGSNCIEIRIE
jgi:hypothetical protein